MHVDSNKYLTKTQGLRSNTVNKHIPKFVPLPMHADSKITIFKRAFIVKLLTLAKPVYK